jgi:hypothetical protein
MKEIKPTQYNVIDYLDLPQEWRKYVSERYNFNDGCMIKLYNECDA